MIIWHKILGVTLVDFFTDTPYSVEIEKELKILLLQLMEVNKMSYTVKDFQLEVLFDCFTQEEILKRFKPEDRLKGLRPEDRLKGLRPEDRLKGLRAKDRLTGLKPENISPDEIEFFENLIKQARRYNK